MIAIGRRGQDFSLKRTCLFQSINLRVAQVVIFFRFLIKYDRNLVKSCVFGKWRIRVCIICKRHTRFFEILRMLISDRLSDLSRIWSLSVKSSRVRSSRQIKHITAIDIFAFQCWYHTRLLLFVCLLSKLTLWSPRFDMQDENLGILGLLYLFSTAQKKKTASIIIQIRLVHLAFGLFVGILFFNCKPF